MQVILIHPRASMDDLGFLPMILLDADPRPFREQIEARYQHGGGYRSLGTKFEVTSSGALQSTEYPDDRPMAAILEMRLPHHSEYIILYQASVVRVIQADGSFDVIRMD